MIDPNPLLLLGLETISLMTLVVIGASVLREHWPEARWVNSAIGVMLGLTAVTFSLFPADLGDGVILDGRDIAVGCAAAFFGRSGGLIALALAVCVRLYIGDIGTASSILGLTIACLMGVAWRRALPENWRAGVPGLFILALMLSAHMLAPMAFLPRAWWGQFYQEIGKPLFVVETLGTLVFGMLIRREFKLQSMTASLRRAANTDPLTGLANRRHLRELHDQHAARGTQMSLLYLDLDHFKQINDQHGHAAGDVLLTQVAHILETHIPKNALAVRLGGEEFAILFTNLPPATAAKLAHYVWRAIGQTDYYIAGERLSVTASAGLSHSHRAHGFDDMLIAADRCLYRAKAQGRDRLICAKTNPAAPNTPHPVPLAQSA